jgi:hypothetical protein
MSGEAEVFGSQLRYWHQKAVGLERDIFVNSASALKDSIVNGSPVTGAPMLPVDTGALRAGVQLEFDAPDSALIYTKVDYAEIVELNIRGVTFRVGGPFGWTLSRAGFGRIVEDETRKVAA